MLYDPKWEVRSKPAVFSLEGLIAWLETKDPATPYCYTDIGGCLLSQYFRAAGYRWSFCGATSVNYSRLFLPPVFSKSIPWELDDVAVAAPRTFGAALKRARAANSAAR